MFVLDTGAGHDTLNVSFASRLSRLNASSSVRVSGVAGTLSGKLPTIKDVSIAIGNAHWITHSVPIVDLTAVEAAVHHPIDGLLAPAHIPSAAVTFDYLAKVVVFESSGLALLPQACILHFDKRKTPVVQAYITAVSPREPAGKAEDIPVRLLIDTGADHTLLLNSPFSARHPELLPAAQGSADSVTGIAGSMPVSTGTVQSLRLGMLYTDQIPFAASSSRDGVSARTSVDGSVGGALMVTLRMTIDYRHGLVAFQPGSESERQQQLSGPCAR
jgi:Aspartyl protease